MYTVRSPTSRPLLHVSEEACKGVLFPASSPSPMLFICTVFFEVALALQARYRILDILCLAIDYDSDFFALNSIYVCIAQLCRVHQEIELLDDTQTPTSLAWTLNNSFVSLYRYRHVWGVRFRQQTRQQQVPNLISLLLAVQQPLPATISRPDHSGILLQSPLPQFPRSSVINTILLSAAHPQTPRYTLQSSNGQPTQQPERGGVPQRVLRE